MKIIFLLCFITIIAIIDTGQSVSPKVAFSDDDATLVTANSTQIEGEDVEVKHTIVVSTKLSNSNKKGIHSRLDGDYVQTYNNGDSRRTHIHKEDDSGEVPIVKGYKAVETTEIKSPDTRHRPQVYPGIKTFNSRDRSQIYPESVFVSRNIRDDLDYYPNVAINPLQWKPSSFFNNINWWQQDGRDFERRSYRPVQETDKFNKRISDDSIKEFYCKKCREFIHSSGRGCIQQKSNSWIPETTTPKLKLDGKLAKLN
ncbi:hypothetical protein ACJJTC_015566 [Scirpophaga incertulas]